MVDIREREVRAWPVIFGTEWTYKKLILGYLTLALICPPLMFFLDQELSLRLGEYLSKEAIRLWSYITLVGEAGQYLLIFLFGYLFLRFIPTHQLESVRRRRERLKRTFLLAFTCFLTSGVLVLILKFLFGRQRPYGSETYNALVFEPFNFSSVFQSFPSGHTQVIFTLAAFLSLAYPRFNLLYLALGVLIAFSRLTVFNHYLSDIIAGSFVGLTGVVLSYHFFYKKALLPEQFATEEGPGVESAVEL